MLDVKRHAVTLRAVMHNLCIFSAPDVQSKRVWQSNTRRICIYSAVFALRFLNADLVFSLPFLNSCLQRKCIFCIAQLKGCIFADLKEERENV